MTREEQIAVLRLYDQKLKRWEPEQCPRTYNLPVGLGRGIKHARWMAIEMLRRLEHDEEASPGQADRWIGFIQGILWTHALYTIDDMAKHNVPPKEES